MNKLAIWAIAGVIGLASIGAAITAFHKAAYDDGYSDGWNEATAKCQGVMDAIATANRKAVQDAQRDLFKAADELSVTEMELTNALDDLAAAAAAGPIAGNVCIDDAARLRLNSIARNAQRLRANP